MGAFVERILAEEHERVVAAQTRVLRAVKERHTALKSAIFAPGGIEDMVAQGRAPILVEAYEGRDRTKVIHCHVPPEETQAGDKIERIPGIGAYRYTSPEGVVRGYADTLGFTPAEASTLQTRIEAARPQ